jgi:mono/diheme cytochrome c family protein
VAVTILVSGVPAMSETTQERSAHSQSVTYPAGDATRGEIVYKNSCVVCHSDGATGNIGPRLAGNPILSNDKDFWEIVQRGRHIMPPLKDTLTDQQLADIQAWLKTLR